MTRDEKRPVLTSRGEARTGHFMTGVKRSTHAPNANLIEKVPLATGASVTFFTVADRPRNRRNPDRLVEGVKRWEPFEANPAS
jgi:hypothetical protein